MNCTNCEKNVINNFVCHVSTPKTFLISNHRWLWWYVLECPAFDLCCSIKRNTQNDVTKIVMISKVPFKCLVLASVDFVCGQCHDFLAKVSIDFGVNGMTGVLQNDSVGVKGTCVQFF